MFIKNDKILIYPFSYKAFPIVKLLLREKLDVIVAAEEGSGLIGKDVAFSTNREKCNLAVLKYSDNLLEESDILIIPEGHINDAVNEGIKTTIEKTISKSKKIASLLSLDKESQYFLDYDEYINLATTKSLNIESYFKRVKENNLPYFVPNIPVIFMGGVFDIIDNNYIAISLKQRFEKDGYKVCCITKEDSGKLFDCLTYPKSFMNNELSIEDRITELNHYIRTCVEIIKPQVLIMQIPFGMIRYNEYLNNSFGSYAFMISQAVKCDYFVCTAVAETVLHKYYEELSDYFYKRFDSPIDSLHISNCQLDLLSNNVVKMDNILFMDESEVENIIKNLKEKLYFKTFNLFKENDMNNLYQDILDKLG